MILIREQHFELHTHHTSYLFHVEPCGVLAHDYYGRRIHSPINQEAIKQKKLFAEGNSIFYSEEYKEISLENLSQEISTVGKGDISEALIELRFADGSRTCDFQYEKSHKYKGTKSLQSLPTAYVEDEEQAETLEILLKDRNSSCSLYLYYTVFYDTNVIAKHMILKNTTEDDVFIDKVLSNQIDFPKDHYVFTTFHGAWAREMDRVDREIKQGRIAAESRCGVSSNRANPFCMIAKKDTVEEYGDCYGFHLIYSGNHIQITRVPNI